MLRKDDNLLEWLTNQRCETLIVQFGILDERSLIRVTQSLKVVKIALLATELKENVRKIQAYLTKRSQDQGHLALEQFLSGVIQMVRDLRGEAAFQTQELHKLYQRNSAVVEAIILHMELLKHAGTVIELVDHFFNKENYHFQDINSSEETAGRVSPNVVNAVLQLVRTAQKVSEKITVFAVRRNTVYSSETLGRPHSLKLRRSTSS